MCAVAERPILFSPAMIRAYFAGRKSVTRRVLFFPDPDRPKLKLWDPVHGVATFTDSIPDDPVPLDKPCPYGAEGDSLYVRESFVLPPRWNAHSPTEAVQIARAEGMVLMPRYPATDPEGELYDGARGRPSIHLPRALSRARLELLDVRPERLHQIDEADAVAEGTLGTAEFASLWDRLNGERFDGSVRWDRNPWVWRLEFPPYTPALRKALERRMTAPREVQKLIAQVQALGNVTAVFIYDLPEGKQATFTNGDTEKALDADGGFFSVGERDCFTVRLVWTPRKDEDDV